MTESPRVRRHAERVRELVASVVRTQIKDPRLGMITITDTRMTSDLREATVYYTVLGDDTAKAATAAALRSANGLVRSTVGKALGLRHSPSLTFVLDEMPQQVRHIDQLLDAARDADEQVQRRAAAARYAGDPNPYRAADEADEGAEEAPDDAEPGAQQSEQAQNGSHGPAGEGLR